MLQLDAIALIVRRRGVFLAVFCVTVVAYAIVMFSDTSEYESRAVLRFRVHEAPKVSAGGLESVALHEPFTRDDLDLLLAAPDLPRTLEARLADDDLSPWQWNDRTFRLESEGEDHRFVVARFFAEDPSTARRVLEAALAEISARANAQFIASVRESRTRWSEWSEKAENERRQRLGTVRELRVHAGLSPDGTGIQDQFTRLDDDLDAIVRARLDAETALAEVASRIEARRSASAQSVRASVLVERLAETPAAGLIETIAERAIEAELELARLRGTYAEAHPVVDEARRVLETESGLWHAAFDPETPLGRHIAAVLSRFSPEVGIEATIEDTAALAARETRLRALRSHEDELHTRRQRLESVAGDLADRELLLERSTAVVEEIGRAVRTLALTEELHPEVLAVQRAPRDGVLRSGTTGIAWGVVLIVASLLAYGAALAVDSLDPSLRDSRDLRLPEGVTCLGTIDSTELGSTESEEQLRTLVGRLASRLGRGRVLLVAGRGDPATRRAVAEGIARTAAGLSTRTLLVHTDLAGREAEDSAPGATRSTRRGRGLSDYLHGTCDAQAIELESALASSELDLDRPVRVRPSELPLPAGRTQRIAARGPIATIVRPTGTPCLSEVSTGSRVRCAASLLNSLRMGRFIARVRRQFPLVVIDTVDLDRAADAPLLGRGVDGVIHIASFARTTTEQLNEDLCTYTEVGAPILGVVLVRNVASRGAEQAVAETDPVARPTRAVRIPRIGREVARA